MRRQGPCSVCEQLLPPQLGFPIPPTLRNKSRFSQYSNNQSNTPFSHCGNTANASISSPCGATSSFYVDSRRSSNRTSTTRPLATRMNESHAINCIKTSTSKRALMPANINKNAEVQALCEPCADITVI
ncbi:hypothetical protein AVEN_93982-1 [Araneus ventricosus]|uniref:Uncharacterized protein n=1 Tax=Araneus ventricosus TaxID=182803 RepID=A0A4Y2CJJ7_ARAVE|nr:hypothetical protein AVEN_93982-1 [Araneus ventricosus]